MYVYKMVKRKKITYRTIIIIIFRPPIPPAGTARYTATIYTAVAVNEWCAGGRYHRYTEHVRDLYACGCTWRQRATHEPQSTISRRVVDLVTASYDNNILFTIILLSISKIVFIYSTIRPTYAVLKPIIIIVIKNHIHTEDIWT